MGISMVNQLAARLLAALDEDYLPGECRLFIEPAPAAARPADTEREKLFHRVMLNAAISFSLSPSSSVAAP